MPDFLPPCTLLGDDLRRDWCADIDPPTGYVCRRPRNHDSRVHVGRNSFRGFHQWPAHAAENAPAPSLGAVKVGDQLGPGGILGTVAWVSDPVPGPKADERPDSIPATNPADDRIGTVRLTTTFEHLFVKLAEPANEPWHYVYSPGDQQMSGWQSDECMEDSSVVGYVPVELAIPVTPAGGAELDFSALADACEEYVRAYRGSDDPDLPELVDAITKALGRPVEPTVDGDHLAAENARLAAELDAALGGMARARQECNELYEEVSLLKRELTNAQQAYNRTFGRLADIENEELGR